MINSEGRLETFFGKSCPAHYLKTGITNQRGAALLSGKLRQSRAEFAGASFNFSPLTIIISDSILKQIALLLGQEKPALKVFFLCERVTFSSPKRFIKPAFTCAIVISLLMTGFI